MGNFWIAQFDSSSSSSPSSARPSSPGAALFSSPILIHRPLHVCIISHGLPSNPLFQFSPPKFAGITKSTSNEGTHSGTATAFSSRLDEVSPNGQILPITPTLKIFSFAELKKATSKFSPDTFLGEGAFGKVFKGWIDEKTFAPTKAGSGMAIAVKKLNSDDFQGHEEWQSEVNILGSLSHPNIVRLLGYCREDKERLLVYEFIPRGSLSKHLFSRGSAFQSLSWSIRLKIAIGAARAIAFLHCSERKIISRDVKPSNILLDSNYDAKISNFGLAKNGPVGENSHVSTRVMGTYGYAAPEYVATGHLYVKSDVYGFGVVLLEMLSGMRAIDKNRPSGQHNLVEWAKPYLSHRRKVLSRVMDQRLEGQYPSKGAVQAAQLILKCVQSEARRRPSMSEVVKTLEQIQAIKHKPQEPKENPRRPTDHNHAHHRAYLFYLRVTHYYFKKSRSNYSIPYF